MQNVETRINKLNELRDQITDILDSCPELQEMEDNKNSEMLQEIIETFYLTPEDINAKGDKHLDYIIRVTEALMVYIKKLSEYIEYTKNQGRFIS